jgi:predicted O-methyltransferase YrrM
MGQIVPDAIEHYLASLNHVADPVLEDIARVGREEKLPLVDAEVGALLRLLSTATGAKRILEIGTAIGYSGIWLAGALPQDGMLLTLEVDEKQARTARANFERAGLGARANVIVGDARRTIAKLSGPFDVIFLDANKELYTLLLDRLIDLLKVGGLLVADNVLWYGEVVPDYVKTPRHDVESARHLAEYNRRINSDPRLMTVTIPLRDGLAISLKKA